MRSCTSGSIRVWMPGTSAVRARRTEKGGPAISVTGPPYGLDTRLRRTRPALGRGRSLLGLLGQRLAAGLTAGREGELLALWQLRVEVDLHVVARVELAVQDLLREPVLDLVLHRAAQRAGAHGGLPAELD